MFPEAHDQRGPTPKPSPSEKIRAIRVPISACQRVSISDFGRGRDSAARPRASGSFGVDLWPVAVGNGFREGAFVLVCVAVLYGRMVC